MESPRLLQRLTACAIFLLCSCSPNKPTHVAEGTSAKTETQMEPEIRSAAEAISQGGNRKIHVVVVAVPHFAISDYNSQDLKEAFEKRCDQLGTYFTNALGKENVEIHPYCTAKLTTREALRRLFSLTIPGFSQDTVTMIFIMSHGESVKFGNDLLKNDLELITSDTSTSDEVNDAKGERQFTSILFGSELMSWLERSPKRSTILIFLDTCHAGSAASLSTALKASLQQQFGLQYSVIGSSLSQDKSYSALFTKELIALWGQDSCLNQDTLPLDIYNQMKTEAALQNSEGLPEYIVRYSGPLCLGNFGKDRRLLFMYAGQGAEQNPFQYTIAEDLGTSAKIVKNSQQLPFAFLAVPLDAKKYTVSVRRGDQFVGKWPVDLTSAEHQALWLDTSLSSQDVGRIGESMIQAADKNGSSSLEVASLAYRTAAIYSSLGRKDDANRVLQLMPNQEVVALAAGKSIGGAGGVVFGGGSGENVDVLNEIMLLSPDTRAEVAQSKGNFSAAAKDFHIAAEEAADPEQRKRAAKQAYISALASGDFDSAKEVRKKFHLGDVETILGVTGEASYSKDNLRAAGLAATLDSSSPQVVVGAGQAVVLEKSHKLPTPWP